MHAPAAVLTSHVLDMATGRPGRNMRIKLWRLDEGGALQIADVTTNADGRCDAPLLMRDTAQTGTYRLDFMVGDYHAQQDGYLDVVPIEFHIAELDGHYHVPLVLSPYGYSTYRGVPPAHQPRDGGDWHVTSPAGNPVGQVESAAAPGSGAAGMTTHAIDMARGCGADGLVVDVLRVDEDGAVVKTVNQCCTTAEGRTSQWLVPAGELEAGLYELVFRLGDYFSNAGFGVGSAPFFTMARIRLRVTDPQSHHHVPLLAAPWGYTTYRGS
jgi:5-hydroxyisourate hydrolase